jgi:hypothetical protein
MEAEARESTLGSLVSMTFEPGPNANQIMATVATPTNDKVCLT